MEETGIPGENHWPAASHWQTLSHNVVSRTRFEPTMLVVTCTDYIGSYKSNCHKITTMVVPRLLYITTVELKLFIYNLRYIFVIMPNRFLKWIYYRWCYRISSYFYKEEMLRNCTMCFYCFTKYSCDYSPKYVIIVKNYFPSYHCIMECQWLE